ncbi:MAG: hypothetical protein JXR76_18885 [Deltaproteobacteria bacterium]|nr:hypothetical protein [Deltaproteobacteria bacterium]
MLQVKKNYFEQNRLLLFTLEGEITDPQMAGDELNTPDVAFESDCLQEIVDCRRLEVAESVDPEDLVDFAKKILSWRDCEMLLLIPADSPLHQGMAVAFPSVIAKKRRRIWLHYTVDEAINLLNLIQINSPVKAIMQLKAVG